MMRLTSSKKILSALSALIFSLVHIDVSLLGASVPLQSLEFEQAYQYALQNAMKIKIAEAEVGIREGERIQEGLYPNPTLTFGIDDAGREYKWEDNEISLGITQLFELGGKRAARVRVAQAAQCETSWETSIVKCDLYGDLLHAFIAIATAQERLVIAEDLHKIAEQSLHCISNKALNGKASPIEAKKSEISLRTARILLSKRQAELQQRKRLLSSFWNCEELPFERVNFPLYDIDAIPPFEDLVEELSQNPELSRSQAEIAKTWEIIELERRQRIPDMSVYVGVCTERFYRQAALGFGVSIPLPIFDRNQGNIHRATYEYNQALYKQCDLICQLKTKMTVLYEEWKSTYEQATALQEIVSTTAKEAFELTQQSYDVGHCEYLDFLDTRTTLFNIRQQYLDAIEEYHHKRADILRLTAKCCASVFE